MSSPMFQMNLAWRGFFSLIVEFVGVKNILELFFEKNIVGVALNLWHLVRCYFYFGKFTLS
jgi:hypothetical protein